MSRGWSSRGSIVLAMVSVALLCGVIKRSPWVGSSSVAFAFPLRPGFSEVLASSLAASGLSYTLS